MTPAEKELIDVMLALRGQPYSGRSNEDPLQRAARAVRKERLDALDQEWREKAKDALLRHYEANRDWADWCDRIQSCLTQQEFSDFYDWAIGKPNNAGGGT